jgi:hypothetical protein
MTGDTDSISEQAAIDKIVAELLANGLIQPTQKAALAADLTRGLVKAEDWRLLAEKALMLAEKRHA